VGDNVVTVTATDSASQTQGAVLTVTLTQVAGQPAYRYLIR
jgi:hypothetical protein